MSRMRVVAMVVLFVAGATWVTWLVMSVVVTNRIECGLSFVQDEACWTTEKTVAAAALVLSGGLAFGYLVARTFMLLIADRDLGRAFRIARVASVCAAIAVAGVVLMAVGDADDQGVDAARSQADVFVSHLPAIGGAALAWTGALLCAEWARRYRRPLARAHSSR